ncbi:leucine-rich repeat domain-containing protein [Reichenbachiella versicolor]|uniref:leucine-rich repeat domain-containing protein n=1 Tax=Reichenbachiella versicolor TaxID=1821036 RepID=UPI000D6E77FD|nr:leucine-rich repeat domain-containing protein [Reichenbachiella versicolor]
MNEFIKKLNADFKIEIHESSTYDHIGSFYIEDERGLVTDLHLCDVNLKSLDTLIPIASSLTHLSLENCKVSSIEQLGVFENLIELEIDNNPISNFKDLELLNNLKKLVLVCLDIDSTIHLPVITSLTDLSLASNFGFTRIEGLENLPHLEYLDLSGNDDIILDNIPTNYSVKTLKLDTCKLDRIQGLEKFRNLEFLSLYCNSIQKIEGLDSLTSLKKLSLHNNEIRKIEGLEKLELLEELDLSYTEVEKIEGLEKLHQLKELGLAVTNVRTIEGLDHLKNLKVLMLDGNGLSQVNELPLQNLKILYLSKNQICDIPSNWIKMEEIHLNGNCINDVDPKWMSNIVNKCYIDLTHNPIKKIEGKIPDHITVDFNSRYGGVPTVLL